MAVKDKLDDAWGVNKAMDAVFEVRAQAANVYQVLQETIVSIDATVAGAAFDDVDAKIKTEGAQIISILKQAKAALDNHEDFLKWSQS